MMQGMTVIVAVILTGATSAYAQQVAPSQPAASAQPAATPDTQIRAFLSELLAGRTEQAVDGLLGASTTPAQKPGERENLLAQLGAALQTYGPITTYEKANTQAVGSMAVREYYLVQHRVMLVRWEFVVVRTGTGWRVDYFGFDDQPRTWF